MLRATVNKILTYSVVDGPGNRMVIFLQGCNFACAACHNPYTIGVCDDCGDCLPVCEPKALTLQNGKISFDATLCTDCDNCLDICPISASPMVQQMNVDDILEIARKHHPFLTGITVSGGEATMQLKFIAALFTAIKAEPDLSNLTCFIDTNGHLGPKGWSQILPVTDGVMMDVKAFDPTLHRTLTGQGNTKLLRAARIVFDAGKLYELRFMAAPDVNDTEKEITALADFALSLSPQIRIRINAFQLHGVKGKARDWNAMDKARVDQITKRLNAFGLQNIVTPAMYL